MKTNVVKKTNLHVVAKEKNVKKNDKKRRRKIKTRKTKDRDEESQDDDWICEDCGDHWDDDREERCISYDLCGSKFHLQCSGIQYRTSQYWTLDLDNVYFECDECK